MSDDRFLPSFEGTWARLSQVIVKGAQYNSPERQPHPKCLEGTRIDLLKYIHELLDDPEKNQLIWLHGTAGVGKSAVAFTVAEKMRGLKVTQQTNVEKRLAGTFFFSRKHTKRCTTGYFFATLVYQLANNFPNIRKDVNRVIRDDPALLDPDTPLCDQMEALFLQPLRWLRSRLRGCAPLTFVIDALDECTSEPELVDLIISLAQALRDPDLPVTHILLTSRSESHISKIFQNDAVRSFVCEIPVKTSGEGIGTIISLDGADVDNDIYIFLRHSFRELGNRHPDFPQPSRNQLAQLASRAGRRFIVASTMVKFITDDENKDPRDRLQLMLELTSELLAGTDVYKLYDCILSTCANPKRAYLHLSIVAALADPLPLSQISKLLGPGQGYDAEKTLIQLRSVMDIPTDNTLPVNIYHSSVRDYVSDPSNCSLPDAHNTSPAHSLLADSSLRLMMKEIPESTALLDELSALKKQNRAMQAEDPHRLKDSLSFLVQPPEPLSVLIGMLWLRGDHKSDVQSFLETVDGWAWLQTQNGRDWLQTQGGQDWLQTPGGRGWLQIQAGRDWLQVQAGRDWLQVQAGRDWLQTQGGRDWLRTQGGRDWLQTPGGRDWLQTQGGQDWLQTLGEQDWLQTQGGRDWLQTQAGRDWLQIQEDFLQILEELNLLLSLGETYWLPTQGERDLLQAQPEAGRDSLHAQAEVEVDLLQTQPEVELDSQQTQPEAGRDSLQTQPEVEVDSQQTQPEAGRDSLQAQPELEVGSQQTQPEAGRDSLQTQPEAGEDSSQIHAGYNWLQAQAGRYWLQTEGTLEWLQTQRGRDWLQTGLGRNWLGTQGGKDWLRTPGGRDWIQTKGGRDWLGTQGGKDWLQTPSVQDWLQTPGGRDWMQTEGGRDWLGTQGGKDWSQTRGMQDWMQTPGGRDWMQTEGGRDWLGTQGGKDWSQTQGMQDWMQTSGGRVWMQTKGGRDWLGTQGGKDWSQTRGMQDWMQTPGGRDWMQTKGGRDWLGTQGGLDWLKTPGGRDWLWTPGGRDWLQTPDGQAWQSTPAASVWVTMEEFSSTLEAISEYIVVPELPLLPTFQVVQQFKSLPDFLMFPMFLALMPQNHFTSALSEVPDREIIRAMNAFTTFANEAQERSQSASDAFKYACQNWVVHLSRTPNPWDDTLNRIFHAFWNCHLLSWLERQWCLKGLRSCLDILSKGQKLAKIRFVSSYDTPCNSLVLIVNAQPDEGLSAIGPDIRHSTTEASHASTTGMMSGPSTPTTTLPTEQLLVALHTEPVPTDTCPMKPILRHPPTSPLAPSLPPVSSAGPDTAVFHVRTSRKRKLDELQINSDSPHPSKRRK